MNRPPTYGVTFDIIQTCARILPHYRYERNHIRFYLIHTIRLFKGPQNACISSSKDVKFVKASPKFNASTTVEV
jgi:hypothetical protein